MEQGTLLQNIFNNYEIRIFNEFNDLLSSDTAILEVLKYYEDICLRSDIIKEFEADIKNSNILKSLNKNISKFHINSGHRKNHNSIIALELLINKNIEKINFNKLKVEQCTFNDQVSNIEKNINMLLDYYDLFIAKNAVESGRYDIVLKDNTIKFTNKDYNKKYNIQGYIEKIIWRNKGKKLFNSTYDIGEKKYINSIYNELVDGLITLKPIDNLGVYSVHDFIGVWSILKYLSYVSIGAKLIICKNNINTILKHNIGGIRDFFDLIWDYVQNRIVGNNSHENSIGYINVDYVKSKAKDIFNIDNGLADKIIGDLMYKDTSFKFSLQEYPLLEVENGIAFSNYYINNEIAIEILMKKKSKSLYKGFYDKVHTEEIEPRICKEIENKFSKNKRFMVKSIKDVISENNGQIQSQIDIFLYDINKKDIMIIEVKDHIEKLDTRNVVNQVRFEMNTKKKGNAVQQLKLQKKLIEIQNNLEKYIDNVSIDEINNIYLGYCETFYSGTPKFIDELNKQDIAFIPYSNLLKKYNFKSLKELYDHYYFAKYISSNKDSFEEYTIKIDEYDIIIPSFKSDN